MRDMARYGTITLIPLAFLILSATLQGAFAYAALLWLTLVAGLLDTALPRPKGPEGPSHRLSEHLPTLLGIGHLLLLPIVLLALAGPALTIGEKVALFFATASFVGQVSHPAAHELIHGRTRALRALGAAVYISIGYGHHVPAHRMVHHAHVGTHRDPNTPLPGEGFWQYLPRAWAEEFQAGLEAEEARLERAGLGARNRRNIYWVIIGGEALALLAATLLAGPVGILAYLGLWLLAGAQILMSDYLQHYGLQRLQLPSGRLEPVGPHHSWDAPRGFSSYLMMNAPSHSEHHLHPDRPYDSIGPGAAAPRLPFAMPVMAMIAVIPALWHRVMDPRALKVMEAAEARIAAAHAEIMAEKAEDIDGVDGEDDTVADGLDDETATPSVEQTVATGQEDDDAPITVDATGAASCDAPEDVQVLDPPQAADSPDSDEDLIARVQGLVARKEVAGALAPDLADLPSLKLRRPVRSGRRAALRDR